MKYRLLYLLFFGSSLPLLFAQPTFAQVTQITGIKYRLTEKGLEIILVTPAPQNLLSFPTRQAKTRIFNIPKAQLSLPCGKFFRRENPVQGVQSISVTSENTNQVSVVVQGEKSLPKVIVSISPAKIDCIKCSFYYPEELRKKGIEGIAKVVLDIDEQGNVTQVSLGRSSGNSEIDNAVLTQVRKMKFIDNACGQKNILLRANFIIQGSLLYQQAIEEYRMRERQESLRQRLRKEGE
ncbi:MAG: TonB family protein [Nostoc sp.]|uniref:TonB family protein n=1 Tax=Nostoc sp. TaxID=1180 RepID=UPI002FF37C51